MFKYFNLYIFILSTILLSQDSHFEVELAETGEFQLLIFQETISILEPGDEIGVFDANGVIETCDMDTLCSEPTYGEVLVGAGTWIGEQVNISSIMSIDLTDFNGPILNGATDGNPVIVKIWDASEGTEHIVFEITWEAGSGNFGDLILTASELELIPPHFDIQLEETGEFQLIIFENAISILEPGDEIGVFDVNGVIASVEEGVDPIYGEVLVGSGVWTGEQLNISAIVSVDLSDFGGPVLNGAVNGNPVLIKIWDAIEEIEYHTSAYYSAGTGTYGDVLMAVSDLVIVNGVDLVINEFFFRATVGTSVPDYIELSNIGDIDIDLFGWTLNDEPLSGIIPVGGYSLVAGEDPFFNADGEELYAGIDIPNSVYADINLSTSSDEIILLDPNGSEADYVAYNEDAGWIVGNDNRGHALELLNPNLDNNNFGNWTSSENECESEFLYGEDGSDEELINFGSPAFENCNYADLLAGCMDENACNYNIDAIVDDGSCWYANIGCDCIAGEGAIVDECGNCDTDTENDCVEGCITIEACNYNPDATDDDGSCWFANDGCECEDGEGAIVDDCAVCNGNNDDLDDCGVCFGGNEDLDDCGVCFGNNDDLDDCGVCFGDSFNIGWEDQNIGEQCDCPEGQPQYWDCEGICGGSAEFDCADICAGDNICGCTDSEAWNYNPDATFDDGSCVYEIDYLTQIQPIFDENCAGYCHTNGGIYTANLDLSSYEDLMLGTSNNGPVVTPGDSENSIIIQKLGDNPPFGDQMPEGGAPLGDFLIGLIADWIDEGAIGPDGDGPGEGGIGDECTTNEGYPGLIDCSTNCVDESNLDLLGDGNCNDGSDPDYPVNFNCVEWSYDLNNETMTADCPLGFLDFGLVDTTMQSIEVILDCQYSVSQFQFNVSGLTGISIYGGSSEGFEITIDNTLIIGESDSLLIPAHDELLMYLSPTGLTGEDVCFSFSNIITSVGIQYQAVEGECIPFEEFNEGWLEITNLNVPMNFQLFPAYPNPFNPIVMIDYSIDTASDIHLIVYDLQGNLITTLVNDYLTPAFYSASWDAKDHSSGIYFVSITSQDLTQTQKIIFLK